MKRRKSNDKMATTLVSLGLCVVALGAGVSYYAWDQLQSAVPQEVTGQTSPVTAAKTPSLQVTKEQSEQMSDDGGEEPDRETVQETVKTTVAKQEEKKTETAQFIYPLTGEILLPYSVETAIYDPTLEQYRTNDNICMAAEEGTPVMAVADGTVAEIKDDERTGRTVVIDHADGWRTTYSPLSEDVAVAEGDTVGQGETIGTVGQPEKYGAALGSHLQFSMEQNGEKVDPQTKLK
ncbi:M23 family metallopeptidase [Anaerotignum lactatifermentans]|uniref:M23 family metallopeptidase n=1 Tax=Anaerotignum lactatifermentans TaxID=160404 RepID=A0ABS2G6Y1_9FIRM|nr:M23 family metallopeptidase [Anaerotignum lactatifermentans]MBM6829162.1 M23 family metallopeptidase [Anaerotignum lactatifermentans]MBM6877231.1 M23 family metallopeptidase [Anaerotignum lactatifermentans]MBM6950604.1 M23 family metallopeptidase [Anaerotignum lactatifermentans]